MGRTTNFKVCKQMEYDELQHQLAQSGWLFKSPLAGAGTYCGGSPLQAAQLVLVRFQYCVVLFSVARSASRIQETQFQMFLAQQHIEEINRNQSVIFTVFTDLAIIHCPFIALILLICRLRWGCGIKGMMRGMATLPQGDRSY